MPGPSPVTTAQPRRPPNPQTKVPCCVVFHDPSVTLVPPPRGIQFALDSLFCKSRPVVSHLTTMVIFLCIMASTVVAFAPLKQPFTLRSPLQASKSIPLPNKLLTTAETRTIDSKPNIPSVEIVNTMPEHLPESLHNDYYFLRHGLSTANVDSIISSDRNVLAYTDKHGLTETGYEQGVAAADQLLELISKDNSSVVFVSSPFARARQTATACLEGLLRQASHLDIDTTIYLHPNLMERSFGRLDGEAIETYAYVWPLDAFNVTHTAFDVESVAAVCHRFRQCILELEETFREKQIVLVSHADVLQICQLYAAMADNVGAFSSYRFKNGEVRKMVQNDPSSLPEPSPLEKPDRSTKQG